MLLSASWSLKPDYDNTVNIYRSFQEYAAMRFSGANGIPESPCMGENIRADDVFNILIHLIFVLTALQRPSPTKHSLVTQASTAMR